MNNRGITLPSKKGAGLRSRSTLLALGLTSVLLVFTAVPAAAVLVTDRITFPVADGETGTLNNGVNWINIGGGGGTAGHTFGFTFDQTVAVRFSIVSLNNQGECVLLPPGTVTESLGEGVTRTGDMVCGIGGDPNIFTHPGLDELLILASGAPGWFRAFGFVEVTADVQQCVPNLLPTDPAPAGYNKIVGTDGDDTISGTAGPDVIFGLGGNDSISALGGDDIVIAGSGDDRVTAGDGNDAISGGDGNDSLTGIGGDDCLAGDAGNDSLTGGSGNDVLYGGEGDDAMTGGSGNDAMTGGAGNDRMTGGDGSDSLDAGEGTDYCDGGSLTDTGNSCETSLAIP